MKTLTALALLAVAAAAHHGVKGFLGKKQVKLQGVVTKVDWINPHVLIHMDVSGADGRVENWLVEASSALGMQRGGIKRGSLAEGTAIVVEGYAAGGGALRITALQLTLPGGKTLRTGNEFFSPVLLPQ